MATVKGQLIMEHDYVYYWKDKDNKFHIINEGFTDMTQSNGATTDSRQYIGDKQARNKTTGLTPAFSYTGELIYDDAFCERIYEIGKDQLVGVTEEIYEVEAWKTPTESKLPARKYLVEVQPDNPGSGSGGGSLAMSGSLAQQGDIEKGMFTITNGSEEFTPNTSGE